MTKQNPENIIEVIATKPSDFANSNLSGFTKFYLFCLWSIKSFTTEGSANVDVSPKSWYSLAAIFLKILLIILPERVFGS